MWWQSVFEMAFGSYLEMSLIFKVGDEAGTAWARTSTASRVWARKSEAKADWV
jgi:hypothetical protein